MALAGATAYCVVPGDGIPALPQVQARGRGSPVQDVRGMSGLVHQGREEAGAEAEAQRPLPEVR